MNLPVLNFVTQIILQKTATNTDVVTTRMPLLNCQTSINVKVCTLEKNPENIKTATNSNFCSNINQNWRIHMKQHTNFKKVMNILALPTNLCNT